MLSNSQTRWAVFSAILVCVAGIASAEYTIQDCYNASNFFDTFDFFTAADPTNGYVQFLDQDDAVQAGLAAVKNGQIYMGVDYTTMNPSGGRAAIRVTSPNQYNHGLFIADIAHMPGEICGVWPAFWTVGPNWPSDGEIDIMEGVNDASTNAVTLHTSAVCSVSNAGAANGTTLTSSDCNSANAADGCSERNSNIRGYGKGFNAIGGGVYAMEWTSNAISIYFFERDSIPSDISAGYPNVSTWDAPQAQFSSDGGDGCDIDEHFSDHTIVFDTTFCGDWAGNVFSSDTTCASLAATCDDYVANNPGDFANAYWLINSLKVYVDTWDT